MVIQCGERRVELAANFFALKRTRSSVDGDFSHGGGDVNFAVIAFEKGRMFDKIIDFVRNQWNV